MTKAKLRTGDNILRNKILPNLPIIDGFNTFKKRGETLV